ncbi:rCG46467, isoform CRA_a [Rattus norvegicus]|uniref:RCG46467, isoform CRA_a n=1 Tax=Rattus norvegicus TaxID=10116 RepID=A6ICC2_RAT|nr:rCG46467, isoform CRA_a [Rattus norvegicus]EDM09726.1 rCG46467, isoform CRA_a [Rattus norvegicus]
MTLNFSSFCVYLLRSAGITSMCHQDQFMPVQWIKSRTLCFLY